MMNLDEMYATALVNRQTREPVDVMRDGSEMLHFAQADDTTAMATEMAGGTEPEGARPMTLQQFGETIADVPAGLLKGAIQGTIGLPGDIEALVYGVRELMGRGADEGMLDAFVRGIETQTIMPTTENVKQWLDTNVGPLVPEGSDPRRVEAAKTAEFVGELGGAGQTVVEGTRAAARGARQIGREMATTPPTGAVQLASPPIKLSNKKVGSVFDRMIKDARQDLEEVMFNWQGGVFLNDDADKLITYPGRDQVFSKGKEGGKVTVSKKEMIDWLMSDGPFDERVYGSDIKGNQEYVDQIERLRSIVREAK